VLLPWSGAVVEGSDAGGAVGHGRWFASGESGLGESGLAEILAGDLAGGGGAGDF
jgi:hypothetical protein